MGLSNIIGDFSNTSETQSILFTKHAFSIKKTWHMNNVFIANRSFCESSPLRKLETVGVSNILTSKKRSRPEQQRGYRHFKQNVRQLFVQATKKVLTCIRCIDISFCSLYLILTERCEQSVEISAFSHVECNSPLFRICFNCFPVFKNYCFICHMYYLHLFSLFTMYSFLLKGA